MFCRDGVGLGWPNIRMRPIRRWSSCINGSGAGRSSAQRILICWCAEAGSPGTEVGRLSGPLAELTALRDTVLIAPACHDTASAIAGIPATGNDWAYISSGTWSLVGTLLEQPRNGEAAAEENFTNLGAVGGRICFHKNVNGMWLFGSALRDGRRMDGCGRCRSWWQAAEKTAKPHGLLDVDDPDLLLSGRMLERINAQRVRKGSEAWMRGRKMLLLLPA